MGASLVHGSLVAALGCRIAEVIPQSTSHVTGLAAGFAPNDVQDERIARNLLVLLNLDDVSGIDICPVKQLEELASLIEDKLLDRLLIDSVSSLPQLAVMKQVDGALGDEARRHHCDDVAIVFELAGAGAVHDQPVEGKDAMVQQEEQVVQEDKGADDTLNSNENKFHVFASRWEQQNIATYVVLVESERVRVLVAMQASLGDPVLQLDGALDGGRVLEDAGALAFDGDPVFVKLRLLSEVCPEIVVRSLAGGVVWDGVGLAVVEDGLWRD